jgi:hypothetical protein
MGLDVGVCGLQKLTGAMDGELFDDIDRLTAAVVASARIAFSIYVGKDRAFRLTQGYANSVL